MLFVIENSKKKLNIHFSANVRVMSQQFVQFSSHLNTYAMGLRPLEIFFSLTVRGLTLDVRI